MELSRKRNLSEGSFSAASKSIKKLRTAKSKDVTVQEPVSEEEESRLSDGHSDSSEQENDSNDDRGVQDAESGENVKSSRIQGLYKPPTHSELQTLRETQDLFKSNLMRLQLTELLEEVKPKKKTASGRKLEELLRLLKETLLSLPSSPQVDLCAGLSQLPGTVKYPLRFTPSNSKGKFKFGPPAAVRVVGSYLLGTVIKSELNVDLELDLPMDCLQVKDVLNYRYFHKRALYLSIIAGHLKKKKKSLSLKSIDFEWFCGNPLLPVVSIVPQGKHLSRYTIRLHTSISDSAYFKPSRLAPDRNNVRRDFLSSATSSEQPNDSSVDTELPPTPHYNTSLLLELGARQRHLKELFLSAQECPGIADAILLLKVWSRQRSLDKGYGGFTGFLLSMLVIALVSLKKINKLMSCYQIFRVALQQISSSDWTKPKKDFHSAFEVVFMDSSGLVNLCADTSKERYLWLKQEAAMALRLLDDTRGFEALFMSPLPMEQKHDVLCHINLASLSSLSCLPDQATREGILLDGYAWPLPLVFPHVLSVLDHGLKKRTKLMTAVLESQHHESLKWPLSKSPPDPNRGHMILGLLLDTDHAFSVLNMGPPAESSEAAEFRSFWGDKAEMRRFDDGSINEAVVWGGAKKDGDGDRKSVCIQIIRHLLQRHFSVPEEDVTCNMNVADSLLQKRSTDVRMSSERAMQNVHDTFLELSKELRRQKELPLAVTSLQGTSPTFRYTEVFPAPLWNGKLSAKFKATPPDDSQSNCYYPSCDSATPPLIPVHSVVCQLESSGKWPDEVEAIKKIKVALYINMASSLKGLISSPTEHHLDILKEGCVFRLQIYHHRELALMKERLGKSGDGSSASGSKQLKADIACLQKDMVSLPVLTSTLNGLHQQFPAFGGGARVCKRWVGAHLLSNHLSEEAMELMVAYLFTNPAPYTPPCTHVVVFLRFLSLLSHYDWENEPLILNFNSELSMAQVSDMRSNFSKNRAVLPALVILTPTDQWPSSSPWTSSTHPCPPVLHRLQQLAREALRVTSNLMLRASLNTEDIKQVFRTPLKDFDLLIHLQTRHVPRSEQAVDAVEKDSAKRRPNWSFKCTHLPVVDFDPVQLYLRELEMAFSEFALFFYDKYGGSYIAVLWKPGAFEPQNFKVGKAHCRIPQSDGDRDEGTSQHKKRKMRVMVPDVEAILGDMRIMGEGLVRELEVLKQQDSSSVSGNDK